MISGEDLLGGSVKGQTAKWHAWSHRLMGDVTAIDVRVNFVLALADARTADSIVRLMEVYAAAPLSRRADMIRNLPDPPLYGGGFQRISGWVGRLAAFRNQLAHSFVVDAHEESARLHAFNRGRAKSVVVSRAEMAYAHKMASETLLALDRMSPWVADLEVWGQVMGFDEGQPDSQEASQ